MKNTDMRIGKRQYKTMSSTILASSQKHFSRCTIRIFKNLNVFSDCLLYASFTVKSELLYCQCI